MTGLTVTWVGVTASPDVLAARERARGDRPIGLAAAQRHAALAFLGEAAALDTSAATRDALISALEEIVANT